MTRLQSIVVILFIIAFSVGLIVNNPRYVFAIAALTVFGFITIGFLMFPRFQAAFSFRMGAYSGDQQKTLMISGREVSSSAFAQQFACVMKLRQSPLLLVLAVLSAAAFCLLVSNVPLEPLIQRHFLEVIYLPILLTLFSLVMAMKWYSEQTLLAKAMITLGIVTQVNRWGRYQSISYQFQLPEKGYFGGIERDLFSRRDDQLLFVLYDSSNPDHNISSRGFMFRSFQVLTFKDLD